MFEIAAIDALTITTQRALYRAAAEKLIAHKRFASMAAVATEVKYLRHTAPRQDTAGVSPGAYMTFAALHLLEGYDGQTAVLMMVFRASKAS